MMEETDNQNQLQKEDKGILIKRVKSHPLYQMLFFIIVSVCEFGILELFFKRNAFTYSNEIFMKNVLIIVFINVILCCAIQCIKRGLIISQIFFLIVGIANYFVVMFRGYGIVFMDFYAIKTATTVAEAYDYKITKTFLIAFILGILLIVLTGVMVPKRRNLYRKIKVTLISLCGILVSALFFTWISLDTVYFKDVSCLTWDHNIGMNDYGYILYFSSNAGNSLLSEPVGYSAKKAEKILERYNVSDDSVNDKELPNLIMIMNESYSDLRVYDKIETNIPVMPFYDSIEKNVIKGYAKSSVYGGYTANSEFEFLTGCTKVYMPGNPFLQYVTDYMPSLITDLKKQGYKKAVAMHPYNPSGYNRNKVYPLLGFDEFISLKDFEQKNLVRDYVGDKEDYEKIIELYEKKKAGEKLCLFNVTMQNHNPYNDTKYKFENPVYVKSFPASLSLEQYLSLMRMSDDALKELVTYFSNVDEKTVIVLFGDHQPHLPDNFYKKVTGKVPAFFDLEQVMQKQTVPFMIWANYDIGDTEIENTSINFLSQYVKNVIGVKSSNYDLFLQDVQKELPSISASGYYTKTGAIHAYSDSDAKKQKFLKEYEIVQYYYLFDKKHRKDKYFEGD